MNLLTQGLCTPAQEEKSARNAVDDLAQGVGGLQVTMDRVGGDKPLDAVPPVTPGEVSERVETHERVVPSDVDRITQGRVGSKVRFRDAQGEALEPSQADAKHFESLGFVVVEPLEFIAVETQHLAVRREGVVAGLERFDVRDEAVAVAIEFATQSVVMAEQGQQPCKEQ